MLLLNSVPIAYSESVMLCKNAVFDRATLELNTAFDFQPTTSNRLSTRNSNVLSVG